MVAVESIEGEAAGWKLGEGCIYRREENVGSARKGLQERRVNERSERRGECN
jgi:hypothetical protein